MRRVAVTLLAWILLVGAGEAEDPVAGEDLDPRSVDADDHDPEGGAVDEDGLDRGSEEDIPESDSVDDEAFDWDTVEEVDYTSRTTAEPTAHPGRASTRVEREAMQRRLPRSAPDALIYEPGVSIQQTAQGQASPYIRGRTGQQTVTFFDGVRLNNSLFRQGPNQYFFTIDSATIESIDVLRGSASTVYGSDAIAGAIEARPVSPSRHPLADGVAVEPRAIFGYDSASAGGSFRLQNDLTLSPSVGVFGGFGFRSFEHLRAGGVVRSPEDDSLPEVPRFAPDGKTQLGTGFDEFTGDARIVARVTPSLDLVAAVYNYRQTDAPRTDQCAPPFAPFNECLTYDEQFRTVAYVGLDGDAGPLRDMSLRLSLQRQHERRTHDRPSSFTINGGRDDVTTFGLRGVASTDDITLTQHSSLRLEYGADGYHDRVTSVAWLEFTDLDIVRSRSRGQYLDGSTYTSGGAFTQGTVTVRERLRLRGGARAAVASARAPADPESQSSEVDRTWSALVSGAGAELRIAPPLTLFVGADQGFRAPNLDDLTSRQRTGPGFQLENADLRPERALTLEGGVRVRHRAVSVDAWAYRMILRDAISRASRTGADCPAGATDCRNAWSILQLVNVDGVAVIHGIEGSLRVELPRSVWAQATIAWAWGDEPNPNGLRERQPISRVPPLNGTVELQWDAGHGWWFGAATRWATTQDRLSLSDIADERIPRGGTPGYAIFDARAGVRLQPWLAGTLILANLGDHAYRAHGSSVNGAGRSVLLSFEFGFLAASTGSAEPTASPQR